MAGWRSAVPARFAAVHDGYARALSQAGGLDADTRRAYDSRIRSYLTWLDSAAAAGDPLADPEARDQAAGAYLGYLRTGRDLAASTVNNHLTALDHFYAHLGLGAVRVQRSPSPQRVPRTLDTAEQARYEHVAGQRPPRDRALLLLLLHSGVLPSELVGLDTGDVRMLAGGYLVTVRDGEPRTIPVTAGSAQASMAQWITDRPAWPGAQLTQALFLNRQGARLSTKAVSRLVSQLAIDAGVTGGDGRPAASPRTVRDTYGANQLDGDARILTVPHLLEVSRLMGHRSTETTLRLRRTPAPAR
jgi:integrase/recombinase XerC